ncbi:MAG: aminotransferase class I/II-fold pyridoxal phosphate-dependent enzyme, partial [Victivallales bacterium]|nr:aminotransferase class I/II-fold pyridoxal phosphate-dependent enzyme [Victivallales bacterium]
MADSYLQELFAERIGGNKFGKDTTIYKFEKIKRAKRAAKAAHPDVELIDMGVGEPDDMAFPEVVAALAVEAGKIENRFYSDNGCMEFRISVQKYMKELYGVDLDPETEIVHSIGSKSALTLLPTCFINPGDITLMTVPG